MDENRKGILLQETRTTPEVVDLLPTTPGNKTFRERVAELSLSKDFEHRIIQSWEKTYALHSQPQQHISLSRAEEKELATEVLLNRHRFTELVFANKRLRQAALTVVQNIYLFQNRKIFFASNNLSDEQERQDALRMLSSGNTHSVSLINTFQHPIVARIWNRVVGQISQSETKHRYFLELFEVVERLNTLRNIYVILTIGLVKKLSSNISDIYKQSISFEDTIQIGSFGIARAAYRYHPSCGVRFSTFGARWVYKEIQRQSLEGRLIKISSNTVERFALAKKNGDSDNIDKYSEIIKNCSLLATLDSPSRGRKSQNCNQEPKVPGFFEQQELQDILQKAINKLLSTKSADIIRRRYGLPPYKNQSQSAVAVGKTYGVTRSSIYQQENSAMEKLRRHLSTVYS
ncbi:MAG: sigma-70 family RNA polymerase sigma factor [Desulfobulbaceae bacterium]|nr:sigma-70 family RNA polymerase sigma factor [Desulfobulbaceae bacterium]